MKPRIVALSIALVFALGILIPSRAMATTASFSLKNLGTTTIYHVYVSRLSSSTWGSDALGSQVVPVGSEETFTFNDDSFDTCEWDIAIVYSDGHTAYDWDTNLCEVSTLTSTY